MKIVNISEDKHKAALRKLFKEEVLNGQDPDNQHPFGRLGTDQENTEDGHGESIVGKNVDQTNYGPDQGLHDIVNA